MDTITTNQHPYFTIFLRESVRTPPERRIQTLFLKRKILVKPKLATGVLQCACMKFLYLPQTENRSFYSTEFLPSVFSVSLFVQHVDVLLDSKLILCFMRTILV